MSQERRELRTRLILASAFVVAAALLWWQVFRFTEANWWGFESNHPKKAPPKAPTIKLMGLESVNVGKAIKELSKVPSPGKNTGHH